MSFFSNIYFEGRSDIHTVYLTLIQDELDLQKTQIITRPRSLPYKQTRLLTDRRQNK